MNLFERTAIFTIIENVENQLRGLKTLLAASGNQASTPSPKVPRISPEDEHVLSEEEDEKLEKMMKDAEAHFQKEFETIAKQ